MVLLNIIFNVFSDMIKSPSQVCFSELPQCHIKGYTSSHLRRVQKAREAKGRASCWWHQTGCSQGPSARVRFPSCGSCRTHLPLGSGCSHRSALTPRPCPQFCELILFPLPAWLLTAGRFQTILKRVLIWVSLMFLFDLIHIMHF